MSVLTTLIMQVNGEVEIRLGKGMSYDHATQEAADLMGMSVKEVRQIHPERSFE